MTVCDVFLKDCIVGDIVKWSKSDGLYQILSVRRTIDIIDDRYEDDVQIIAQNTIDRTVLSGTYHSDARVALFQAASAGDPVTSRIALEAIIGTDDSSTT